MKDVTEVIEDLERAGMVELQATAVARAIVESRESILTKDYLDARMEALDARLDAFRNELLLEIEKATNELATQLRAEISQLRAEIAGLSGKIEFQGRVVITTLVPTAIAVIAWVVKHW